MTGEAEREFVATDSTIVTSTIFKLGVPGEYSEPFHYSRFSNPTRDSLESAIASLDGADYAVTFSSKVAASLAVISSLKSSDHAIFSNSSDYEKLKGLNLSIDADFIDIRNAENCEKSLKENTNLVWIESLSLPLMDQPDLKALAQIVHEKSNALLVVDNSLLTPHFLRPLDLGADIVVYSLNEFIAGHGDTAMGAVVTNNEGIYAKLKYNQYSSGAVPSPFDCFMVKRSLKTLSLRMERHSENSLSVAQFLNKHPKVEKVFQLNLKHNKSSPVLSVKIKGSLEDTKMFLRLLKSVAVSECLGSCDTIVTFPWEMSHSYLSEEDRNAAGVTDNLICISVGVEDLKEIIDDLAQALASV